MLKCANQVIKKALKDSLKKKGGGYSTGGSHYSCTELKPGCLSCNFGGKDGYHLLGCSSYHVCILVNYPEKYLLVTFFLL